ncbi:MAG: flagellar filament capping protein FliD [Helicobacteraceae bacterium]|nr:flagellar filament capping protein FliD [Helicobacteraceae bacterium]
MNPLSSLGIGSSVLNYDVIDKLKKADENAQIAPIDRKLQANIDKQTELAQLKTMLSSLNSSAKKISDFSSYLARNVRSSDENKLKVSVNAGVALQDINIRINEIARNSVNELGVKFSSRDDTFSRFGTTLKLYIDSKEYKIDISSTDTLNDVAQKIIDNTDGLINATIMKTGSGDKAYSLMINSKESGENNNIYFGNTLESKDIIDGNLTLNENDFNVTLVSSNGLAKTINVVVSQDSTNNANALKEAIIDELNKDLDFANLLQNGTINVDVSNDGKRIIINDKRGLEIKIDGGKSSTFFSQKSKVEEDTLKGQSSITGGLIEGVISIGGVNIDLGKITSNSNSKEANQKAIVDAINNIDGYYAKINDEGFLAINSNTGLVSIKANEENRDVPAKLGIQAGDYKDWSLLESDIGITNIQKASNANFTYNGVNISRPTNIVDDVVTGVTLELLGESENDINVSVTRDNEGVLAEVKAFVESYNALVPKLDELTRYDEDTKIAGIFNGDSNIRGIRNSLQRALSSTRFSDGKNESMIDYGLSFNDSGMLILNEGKLQGEISANADKVIDFFKGGKITSGGKEIEVNGIFMLVAKELDALISGSNARLNLFEENITNDDKRLKEERKRSLDLLNSRYETMANRFAAYDSQIAKVNNSFNSLNMMIEQAIADKKK